MLIGKLRNNGVEFMEIEDQVCNKELSKKLKELGFKQNSLFDWFLTPDKKYVCHSNKIINYDKLICSAPTVAELTERLPARINYEKDHLSLSIEKLVCETKEITWLVSYGNMKGNEMPELFGNIKIANALAKMLIYLIENKYFMLKK